MSRGLGDVYKRQGQFELVDDSGSGTRYAPEIEVVLGTVGSGPPYTGSTGDQLADVGGGGADEIWERCAIECEARVFNRSSIDYLDLSAKALFTAASGFTYPSPIQLATSINSATFNPAIGLEVFARARFQALDLDWIVNMDQFVVELL